MAAPAPRLAQPTTATPRATPSPAPPEDEDDDPALPIPPGATCKRKACGVKYNGDASRAGEQCVHHPGVPIFHEGSKGYSCCKKRVLEFDDFMRLAGCTTKDRHLFVGSGKKGEETLDTVRWAFLIELVIERMHSNPVAVMIFTRHLPLSLPRSISKRSKKKSLQFPLPTQQPSTSTYTRRITNPTKRPCRFMHLLTRKRANTRFWEPKSSLSSPKQTDRAGQYYEQMSDTLERLSKPVEQAEYKSLRSYEQ